MSTQYGGGTKLPDHSHPSDYSDVHPQSYDPDYISQISSRMQVPHRIAVGSDGPSYKDSYQMNGHSQNTSQYSGMSVPEKIVVAGENQHIGMKQELPPLDFAPTSQVSTESLAYVGLMTPPRTLTLEESFPSVEDTEEKKEKMEVTSNPGDGPVPSTASGQVERPPAYTPAVNSISNDSLLLADDDDGTRLRTQVAKLHRRILLIEQENEKRSQRELVMYPMILGYFVWKILGWFIRDR